MHNILQDIITKKKEDLLEKKKLSPSMDLLLQKLTHRNDVKNKIAIIAEIKLASPSAGVLGSIEEIFTRAIAYEKAGADVISFITEKHYFNGNISGIQKLKETVTIPILQKDFIIDEYQIYEAKSIGSDALLLIARLVDTATLQKFVLLCLQLGIAPIVEINSEEDLTKALETKTKIIAVNARDLETFEININSACDLLEKIPDRFIKLGFSGIQSDKEVKKYQEAGASAVLVGTELMKAENVSNFILSLRGTKQSHDVFKNMKTKVKICGIRSFEHAQIAVAAGADFLGFVFVLDTKDSIDPKEAKKIIDKLRIGNRKLTVKIVGVFQNQPVAEVNAIAESLGLDFVQLHGEENLGYISQIQVNVIKRISSSLIQEESGSKNHELNNYLISNSYHNSNKIKYFLIDRPVQGQGEMVDLEKAKKIAGESPIFFAGGLTPENVTEVVSHVFPFAVDVCSGVMTNHVGDKDKIEKFIKNAKNVFKEDSGDVRMTRGREELL